MRHTIPTTESLRVVDRAKGKKRAFLVYNQGAAVCYLAPYANVNADRNEIELPAGDSFEWRREDPLYARASSATTLVVGLVEG